MGCNADKVYALAHLYRVDSVIINYYLIAFFISRRVSLVQRCFVSSAFFSVIFGLLLDSVEEL